MAYSFDYPVEVGGDFSYTTQINTTPPAYPFDYTDQMDENFEYKTNIAEDYGFLEYNSTDETDTIIKKTNTNLQQTLSQQKTHVKQIKNRFDEIKTIIPKIRSQLGEIKDVFNIRIGATKSELDEIRTNTNTRFSQTKQCLNAIKNAHVNKINDHIARLDGHDTKIRHIENVVDGTSEIATRVINHTHRLANREASDSGQDTSINQLTNNLANTMATVSTLNTRTAMHPGNAWITFDTEDPNNRYSGTWVKEGTIAVGDKTLKVWRKSSS